LVLCACAAAQQEISVQPPTGGWSFITSPYRAGSVPAIRLQNSSRFASLIRAGNLYLSARDVVALAIENNIDVEIQRYGPLLAQQVLQRAQAGGALRSVGLGVAAGPQSVSLQGVSVNASGGVGLSAGNGVGSGGGIVTQLGPLFLPWIRPSSASPVSDIPLSRRATKCSRTVPVLVETTRFYEAQYVQNFEFGLTAQLTYSSTRVGVNSPTFDLNPYTSGDLDLVLTQTCCKDSDGRSTAGTSASRRTT
jgi:outer membrane protein